jgi:hypothetical protein
MEVDSTQLSSSLGLVRTTIHWLGGCSGRTYRSTTINVIIFHYRIAVLKKRKNFAVPRDESDEHEKTQTFSKGDCEWCWISIFGVITDLRWLYWTLNNENLTILNAR